MNKMEPLRFSFNWNNKLNCKVFTTLRRPSQKFYKGAKLEIWLNNQSLGLAEVINIVSINPVHTINEFTSFIDTGYSKEETLNIISKMYKNDSEILNREFWLILLKRIETQTYKPC